LQLKILFFFRQYLGLNSGPHTCRQVLYHSSHSASILHTGSKAWVSSPQKAARDHDLLLPTLRPQHASSQMFQQARLGRGACLALGDLFPPDPFCSTPQEAGSPEAAQDLPSARYCPLLALSACCPDHRGDSIQDTICPGGLSQLLDLWQAGVSKHT
jgi:hypothetical protein